MSVLTAYVPAPNVVFGSGAVGAGAGRFGAGRFGAGAVPGADGASGPTTFAVVDAVVAAAAGVGLVGMLPPSLQAPTRAIRTQRVSVLAAFRMRAETSTKCASRAGLIARAATPQK